MLDHSNRDKETVPGQGALSVLLLPDLPTTKDAFGPHQDLANAIADLIVTEEGGKAIALEGGWGSGKSSVVEMLKDRLSPNTTSDSRASVFVFDAWSHEGDPLRRVFLEELTAFCSTEFDAEEKKNWENRQKSQISGRIRSSVQNTTPILTSSTPLLLLFFLSIFPIAIALIGGLARQNIVDYSVFAWLLATSLVLAMIVPAIMLVLYIYCQWPIGLFKRWKWAQPSLAKESRREKAGRWISLYAKKIDDTTSTTSHETQGPTSIEFQKYFADLASEYLEKVSGRLVIVLDNLDRVPSETARALWSTLRVFAECCEKPKHRHWAGRVWFVVPYDPDAAKRIWDDGESREVSKPDVDEDEKTSEKDEISEQAQAARPKPPRLSAAFLDKTFQIRFDVPPLLLAEWKSFLGDLLSRALSGVSCSAESVHKVYLLSRWMSESKRRPPTPRHLKLFVNDIGALVRRFRAFPIEHLALYAKLRREGHDIRLWLLEHREEQRRVEAMFGETEFVSTLCAVAHGTQDKEKARDLHLRTPIEAAFGSGDGAELAKLADAVGFWEVFEIICDDGVVSFGLDESRVLKSIKCVEASQILAGQRVESTKVKRFLGELLAQAKWNALSDENGIAIASGIQLGLEDRLLKEAVTRLASLADADAFTKLTIDQWIGGMAVLGRAIVEQNKVERLGRIVQVHCSESTSQLMGDFAQLEPSARSQIVPLIELTGDVKSLVQGLLPKADTAWTSIQNLALKSLLEIDGERAANDLLVTGLAARWSHDSELETTEIQWLVERMVQIEGIKESVATKHVKALVTSGNVFRRIKNCEPSLDHPAVGHLVRWAILHHNFAKSSTKPTSAPEGFEILKSVIGQSPEKHPAICTTVLAFCLPSDSNGLVDALLVESKHLAPFATSVLGQLRADGKLGKTVAADALIERFAELKALCSSELLPTIDVVCKELIEDEDFVRSLNDVQLKDESLKGVIALTGAGGLDSSEAFCKNVFSYLKERTQEQWTAAFASPDDAIALLVRVRSQRPDFTLASALNDAFEALLNQVVDGTGTISIEDEEWFGVCSAIRPHEQETIARRVIDRANKPDKHLFDVVSFFEERLKKAAIEYGDGGFVRNCMIRGIESNDVSSLAWIAGVANGEPSFWTNTPESDQESMRQRIQEALERTGDDQAKTLLMEIAGGFGLVVDSGPPREQEAANE